MERGLGAAWRFFQAGSGLLVPALSLLSLGAFVFAGLLSSSSASPLLRE